MASGEGTRVGLREGEEGAVSGGYPWESRSVVDETRDGGSVGESFVGRAEPATASVDGQWVFWYEDGIDIDSE
jgi:hypothetical protein